MPEKVLSSISLLILNINKISGTGGILTRELTEMDLNSTYPSHRDFDSREEAKKND